MQENKYWQEVNKRQMQNAQDRSLREAGGFFINWTKLTKIFFRTILEKLFLTFGQTFALIFTVQKDIYTFDESGHGA